MAIEQEVYNTLNPLSDAQLQEKIQQATSYIEKGFFRDFQLDFCFGLSHLDVTRLNDMYVQSYRNRYVAQKILECRKDSKPYTFFAPVPVPTPAIEEKPVEPETIVREQKYRNNSGINKQQIIDDLKGKTIEESKEYIAILKDRWHAATFYTEVIREIYTRYKEGKINDSFRKVHPPAIYENYWRAFLSLNDLSLQINTAIALTVARVKGIGTNNNTPAPTPPTAPTPEPKEPPKEEEKEDKKGISITTILIGGSLLLGFIYYLKKKH
jgi:hypothetical protein